RSIDPEIGCGKTPGGGRLDAARDSRVDRSDQSAAAVQHCVFADYEELPRCSDLERGHDTARRGGEPAPGSAQGGGRSPRRAPSPGCDDNRRITPGTPAIAALTPSASSAAQRTFTCGPASIEKYASTPRSRSSQTRSIAASVPGSQ